MPDQMSLVAACGQRHGQPIPRRANMLHDNLGMGLDRSEDILVWVIRTVRSMHHKDPMAAGSELELRERISEALRPPPLSEAIRLLESGEYRFWACWQHSLIVNGSLWIICWGCVFHKIYDGEPRQRNGQRQRRLAPVTGQAACVLLSVF